MFNVGGAEIVVVLLVALIVLGPDQLPKAMRTFGNVMSEVRKVSNGFQDEMRSVMNSFDDDGTKGSGTKGSGTKKSAGSTGEKPHSIKPPSGHPSETTDRVTTDQTTADQTSADHDDQRAPGEPTMTEVVARNPARDSTTSPPSTNGSDGAVPPTPDPADRAAG